MSEIMSDRLGDIEEAVAALGRGDPDTARAAIARAAVTDASIGPIAHAVILACEEIESDGEVSPSTWNVVADACPPELMPVVEASRR